MNRLLAVLIMGASLALSGCSGLMASSAPASGNNASKVDRSAGQIARDATITTTVKTKLIANKEVKALKVDVDTYAGVVTLNGTVSRSAQATTAVKLARSVKGVKSVRNRLKVG